MRNRRWFCLFILFQFRFIAVCLFGVNLHDVLSSGGEVVTWLCVCGSYGDRDPIRGFVGQLWCLLRLRVRLVHA